MLIFKLLVAIAHGSPDCQFIEYDNSLRCMAMHVLLVYSEFRLELARLYEYCPGRIVGVQGNPTESNRQLKN
jgi:hypothetical protein